MDKMILKINGKKLTYVEDVTSQEKIYTDPAESVIIPW